MYAREEAICSRLGRRSSEMGGGGGLQTEDTYAPRKSAVWRLSAGREGRGKVRLSPECHLAPQPTAGACHYVVGVAVGSSWRLRRGDLATV